VSEDILVEHRYIEFIDASSILYDKKLCTNGNRSHSSYSDVPFNMLHCAESRVQ